MSSRKHIHTVRKVPDFSSRSLGSHAASDRTIPRLGNSYFGFGTHPGPRSATKAVVVERRLLEPLHLGVGRDVHAIKVQEKEQLKILNDRFASFIEKVRHLEQQNRMLETKLHLLQSCPRTECDIEAIFKTYILKLRTQLNTMESHEELLKAELRAAHLLVDDNKYRYEEEINKRYSAENEFVCLKKDADDGYLTRTRLEEELSAMLRELDFIKTLYDEEVRELKDQLKDTSVVVELDNNRQLDMKQVVEEVQSQYDEVMALSREETEVWYKKKIELISSQVEQHRSGLNGSKSEIAKLKRHITKLQADITAVKAQCKSVDDQITEAERCGKEVQFHAKEQLKGLEEALHGTKQSLARQVRDYQELLNIKLALDIEIATYKKLLEGEEKRTGPESLTRFLILPDTSPEEPVKTITCTSVFVKMIKT